MISNALLIESARALRPRILACADQIEADRKLPQPLVDAIAEAGLFRMFVPREFGGSEVTPEEFMCVIEELSRADGSAGWVVALIANNNISAGCLRQETVRDFFGDSASTGIAGSLAPTARGSDEPPNQALVVDGGYRLTGRWSYASGCMHASVIIAICGTHDGNEPRVHADGRGERRWFFFPKDDCEIIENWYVTGLRGTGSHDFVVHDLFVPAERTLPASSPIAQVDPSILYTFGNGTAFGSTYLPWAGIANVTLASVCLGIARGAIDHFVELAGVKRDSSSKGLLKDNALVQDKLGRAEATLRAARAYFVETLRDAWSAVQETRQSDPDQLRLLALAGTHVATLTAQTVDIIWELAGISSALTSGPFDRRFRDIHVATQNLGCGQVNYTMVGKTFLAADSK